MHQGIQVATDNIYKFLAICGLLLVVSCGLGIVLSNNASNDRGYSACKELIVLEAKKNRTETDES